MVITMVSAECSNHVQLAQLQLSLRFRCFLSYGFESIPHDILSYSLNLGVLPSLYPHTYHKNPTLHICLIVGRNRNPMFYPNYSHTPLKTLLHSFHLRILSIQPILFLLIMLGIITSLHYRPHQRSQCICFHHEFLFCFHFHRIH